MSFSLFMFLYFKRLQKEKPPTPTEISLGLLPNPFSSVPSSVLDFNLLNKNKTEKWSYVRNQTTSVVSVFLIRKEIRKSFLY